MSFIGPHRAFLTSTPRFMLDGRSDVAAAYSLRSLRRGYRGPLVRLRRSSDSAEANIFADRTGALQINSALGWANGSNLFVTKWYDQGGAGRDLARATASAQPAFGALANSLPGMTFDGSNDYLQSNSFALAQPFSFNMIIRHVTYPQPTYEGPFGGAGASEAQTAVHNGVADNLMYAGSAESPISDLGASMAMGVRGAVGGSFNSANSQMEINATTIATFIGSGGTNGFGSGFTVGAASLSGTLQPANMEMQELILFGSAHTSAQLKADNAAMRAAWRF